MHRRVGCALLVAWLVPAPTFAWGSVAHRFIMQRAIDLLPPEIKPLFDRNRDEIVLRVIDPDLWRTAGWEDDPNHFLDFGADEFGPYPFAALPREYGAAIEKFGTATLKRYGLLPWREAEEFGNLRRAFEEFRRLPPAYAARDVVLFTSAAAHYIQDAYQPLHATINMDGQLSGQSGLHVRFETTLFERFQSRLTIEPALPAMLASPRDAAFDALLSSYQAVKPLLEADRHALGSKRTYDDAYFEAFFAEVKPLLEARIGGAITATAAIIVSAWDQAGRPAVRAAAPPSVRRPRAAR